MPPSTTEDASEAIAVIGMAGRFPGSESVSLFWRNLCDGVEGISFFTDEELKASGEQPRFLADPGYVKASGSLEDPSLFDAAFFDYTPRQAEFVDPQQRIFLECAWEALENAGYTSEQYDGAIGVYAGVSMSSYVFNNIIKNPDVMSSMTSFQLQLANDKDFLATSVAYKLDLKGPAITIQTSCSTSLVAICQACQSLLCYQSDMAMAGGVSIACPHRVGYVYQQGGILSPDGHCRTFDAKAQGTVPGCGVGVVTLKRLKDALDDGDRIRAVIRGSALNNDGSAKVGFTAPGVNGQANAIAMAQALAGVDPDTIGYIEAHGTGTELGDPVEIAGLTKAFRLHTNRRQYCAIGSVKSNVGHLDAAAGVTGFIKAVLCVEHNLIPPSLHFESPNPKIDFENSPFYVNTRLSEWPAVDHPRRAGVGSFGIGGTNAHVVLEEAPHQEPSGDSRPRHLLVLSAKSESALDAATSALADYLEENADANPADVAYTLAMGRKAFEHRRVLVCRDVSDAAGALRNCDPKRVFTSTAMIGSRDVAFMFSGQGAQYVDMGKDLYDTEPVFREAVDHCCNLLRPSLEMDLKEVLYPADGNSQQAAERLKETSMAQPALFVTEYALARLWMTWGVEPQAMIGHSIGEYVAACLAGVFSLDDALELVATRGRLMQEMPSGAMLAVPMPASEVSDLLLPGVSLAAVNGPAFCVVSGPSEAIDAMAAQLSQTGVDCKQLHTSHAFHSEMMEGALDRFRSALTKVTLSRPEIPCISNVTGTWLTPEQATDPDYWVSHLRHTVRFSDGVDTLLDEPSRVLLEIGPGTTLTTLAGACLAERRRARKGDSSDQVVVASMRHARRQQPDVEVLLESLGRLWLAGIKPDWHGYYAGERRHRIPLPTYPFERQRYWIEPQEEAIARRAPAGKRPDVGDWFYVPAWKHSAGVSFVGEKTVEKQTWLVFLDGEGLGNKVVDRLRKADQTVVTVATAEAFSKRDEQAYTINPSQRADYTSLIESLVSQKQVPQRVLHFWSVASSGEGRSQHDSLQPELDRGFYSQIYLVQALAEHEVADPLAMLFVSSGMQQVTGNEPLSPGRATLLGPCRVIPQENPNVTCRSIDVEIPRHRTSDETTLIDQLVRECLGNLSDPTVAYRGNRRWVETFDQVKIPDDDGAKTRLREKGVYLITGGLGNIGLALAGYMADAAKARLALTSRNGLPERSRWKQLLASGDENDATCNKIRKVLELEQSGAEVLVIRADAADADQMRKAVKDIKKRFGTLHGVVHAAGAIDRESFGSIQESSVEKCSRQFRPKLDGLIVLDRVLEGTPLDFCLLLSSLSAVLGGLEFVAYSAANLFMDAFARQRNRKGDVAWITTNWDNWNFDTRNPLPAGSGSDTVDLVMTEKEGVEAFGRLMSVDLGDQVIVSTGDLAARIDRWIRLESLRDAEATGKTGKPARHARPKMRQGYVAPRDDLEKMLVSIWEDRIGIDRIGIEDSYFDLGGNSLTAITLFADIQKATGVNRPVSTLYENPTIKELADGYRSSGPAPRPSSIVPVQPAGSRAALFCAPPGGVFNLYYSDLARRLGNEQPFYALESEGFEGKRDQFSRIEDIAAHYIQDIRKIQPQGPYHLGGLCFGGLVVYEMAQQLAAAGEPQGIVALFDTPTPAYVESLGNASSLRLVWDMVSGRIDLELSNLLLLPMRKKLSYFWLKLGRLGMYTKRYIKKCFKALVVGKQTDADARPNPTWHAYSTYQPRPYPGHITLFRATGQVSGSRYDPTMGWGDLVEGELEIHEIPGYHSSIALEPRVEILAEKLTGCLAKAAAATDATAAAAESAD